MRYLILSKLGWLFYKTFYKLYCSLHSLFAYGQLETLRHQGHSIGNNVKLGNHAKIHVLPGGKISIGDNSRIEEHSVIIVEKSGSLNIGENCYLSRNFFLGCSQSVTIGDNVAIGGYVTIIDTNKKFDDTSRLIVEQGHVTIPVVISDDVWIGGNSTLLAGSRIGRHSIIAANTLVRSKVSSNTLAGGVPARIIRHIEGMN